VFEYSDYLFSDLAEPGAWISGYGHDNERDWKIEIKYEAAELYGYGLISLPSKVRIEDFDMTYNKTLQTIPQPLPPNMRVDPTYRPDQPASVLVDDAFSLILYAAADISFDIAEPEGLKVEDIPKLIEDARIEVSQIDEAEPDQETRSQFYWVS
jgi:hypothetical protein